MAEVGDRPTSREEKEKLRARLQARRKGIKLVESGENTDPALLQLIQDMHQTQADTTERVLGLAETAAADQRTAMEHVMEMNGQLLEMLREQAAQHRLEMLELLKAAQSGRPYVIADPVLEDPQARRPRRRRRPQPQDLDEDEGDSNETGDHLSSRSPELEQAYAELREALERLGATPHLRAAFLQLKKKVTTRRFLERIYDPERGFVDDAADKPDFAAFEGKTLLQGAREIEDLDQLSLLKEGIETVERTGLMSQFDLTSIDPQGEARLAGVLEYQPYSLSNIIERTLLAPPAMPGSEPESAMAAICRICGVDSLSSMQPFSDLGVDGLRTFFIEKGVGDLWLRNLKSAQDILEQIKPSPPRHPMGKLDFAFHELDLIAINLFQLRAALEGVILPVDAKRNYPMYVRGDAQSFLFRYSREEREGKILNIKHRESYREDEEVDDGTVFSS